MPSVSDCDCDCRAVENVPVGPANGRAGHADNGVARGLNGGVVNGVDADVLDAVNAEGFHGEELECGKEQLPNLTGGLRH